MIIRKLQSLQVTRHLAAPSHALALCCRSNSTNSLSADFLLSAEHKEHVLNCMKKAPPIGIQYKKTDGNKPFAAVLIALCTLKSNNNAEKSVSILYTRRSIHLSRHVRQVSFPGGLQDHTDCDYIDCALRETEEEIGLPRSRIEIWGTGKIITPPHTAAIMPVFGVVRDFDIAELQLNEDEVEDAFTVDIRDLTASGAVKHTQYKSGFSSPVFLVKPYKIWGVTAFLTNSFLHCLLPREMFKNRVQFIKPYKSK